VVGGWLQIHQPQVLRPYFAARKKNPDSLYGYWATNSSFKDIISKLEGYVRCKFYVI
jgi:hypothetical protein